MPNNDTQKQEGRGSSPAAMLAAYQGGGWARLLWALFFIWPSAWAPARCLSVSCWRISRDGLYGLYRSGGQRRPLSARLAAAVYEGYTNLRDFLFPAKAAWPGPSVHSFLIQKRLWTSGNCLPWWTMTFGNTASGLTAWPWESDGFSATTCRSHRAGEGSLWPG